MRRKILLVYGPPMRCPAGTHCTPGANYRASIDHEGGGARIVSVIDGRYEVVAENLSFGGTPRMTSFNLARGTGRRAAALSGGPADPPGHRCNPCLRPHRSLQRVLEGCRVRARRSTAGRPSIAVSQPPPHVRLARRYPAGYGRPGLAGTGGSGSSVGFLRSALILTRCQSGGIASR